MAREDTIRNAAPMDFLSVDGFGYANPLGFQNVIVEDNESPQSRGRHGTSTRCGADTS